MIHKVPSIIDLPKIPDDRGNLTFVQEGKQIEFDIRRAYWIYDVPGGEIRGSHAFRETEELIIALSGSFDVVLNDGSRDYRFSLNRSYYGVYVPRMIWRELNNFSTNSLALILASTKYDAGDYIRDYNQFRKELLK